MEARTTTPVMLSPAPQDAGTRLMAQYAYNAEAHAAGLSNNWHAGLSLEQLSALAHTYRSR
ncbi:MAG: hypothetical protein GC168_07080 [Candidatus Hydrogenedens sp.]|nr:hypothetical protein [Candidatus Hydrogenedens sp.]